MAGQRTVQGSWIWIWNGSAAFSVRAIRETAVICSQCSSASTADIDPRWASRIHHQRKVEDQADQDSLLSTRLRCGVLPSVNRLHVRATAKTLNLILSCLDDTRTQRAAQRALRDQPLFWRRFKADDSFSSSHNEEKSEDIEAFRREVLEIADELGAEFEAASPAEELQTLADLDEVAGYGSAFATELARRRRMRGETRGDRTVDGNHLVSADLGSGRAKCPEGTAAAEVYPISF